MNRTFNQGLLNEHCREHEDDTNSPISGRLQKGNCTSEATVYHVEPVLEHSHKAIILLNGSSYDVDAFVTHSLPAIAIQFPSWRWVFPVVLYRPENPRGRWFDRN